MHRATIAAFGGNETGAEFGAAGGCNDEDGGSTNAAELAHNLLKNAPRRQKMAPFVVHAPFAQRNWHAPRLAASPGSSSRTTPSAGNNARYFQQNSRSDEP
ncbi:MAG TPA: hypothetical protein PKN13_06770 [Accumulibacter sp.]|nr:hypothetical protein [Accumulibacter sp.]HMW17561.1 hypothetical protein [Accumulibacter sp.]HMX23103.1 hypothetical protein [Accumulibacter sp.]HNC17639.1 hypothetical protein [Accumulibacter sp.]HNG37815.1 hypothetical protein [Accumulibacter sp.]